MNSTEFKSICAATVSPQLFRITKTPIGRGGATSLRRLFVSNFRQKVIIETLILKKRLSTASLAKEFGVSKITIRRDLEELANTECLMRIHGGAIWCARCIIDEVLVLQTSEN